MGSGHFFAIRPRIIIWMGVVMPGNRGQLFTLDLMLAIVPLAIAIGLSANAISGMGSQIMDYSGWFTMERDVNDALDTLVKTPGTPPDWGESGIPETPGLVIYNNATGYRALMLDLEKLSILESNPEYLESILGKNPPYYNLTVTDFTENNTFTGVSIANGTRNSTNNIYASQRLGVITLPQYDAINYTLNVSHTGEGSYCFEGGNPIYRLSFPVVAGESTLYDFWLVGIVNSTDNNGGTAKAWVTLNSNGCFEGAGYELWNGSELFPCPITETSNVGCGKCDESGNPEEEICCGLYNEGLISWKRITAQVTEGVVNYIFIKLPSGAKTRYYEFYIIRTGQNAFNADVDPISETTYPVRITLEVGR